MFILQKSCLSVLSAYLIYIPTLKQAVVRFLNIPFDLPDIGTLQFYVCRFCCLMLLLLLLLLFYWDMCFYQNYVTVLILIGDMFK